ncbi:melanocyte-stimulating hormone receptor-like [Oculina patagonica]
MSLPSNTSFSLAEVFCHGPLTDSLRNHLGIALIVNISFHILNSITATFENLLVLVAIWRTPSLHSPTNTLLFGLALSDLCVACVAQPLFITLQILIYSYYGYRSCTLAKATIFMNIFFSKVALLTMTVISIDRYLAVYLHLRYREIITKRKIKIMLPALWIVGGTIASTSFLTITILQWTLLTAESICILIAFYVWIKIYQVVRHHLLQIQHQAHIQEQQFNMVEFKKSASHCMLLMFVYLLCYLPQFIFLVRIAVNLNKNSFERFFISYTAVVLNSSLNPLVYCWRNRDIRTAVKQILKKISCQV